MGGDTVLHFATQQADQDAVKMLLSRGAGLGVKNDWGRTPADTIAPDTLQAFLDDCVVGDDDAVSDREFRLTFCYDFLKPPQLDESMAHQDLPETEVNLV